MDHLGAINLVSHDAGNILYGTRRHTPVSDHLMNLLGPLAAADAEREFERLEVLLALHYLQMAGEGGRYTLRGRFVWDHWSEAIKRVLAEIETSGDAWSPLAAGLFGGSAMSAKDLIDRLCENVRKMANHYR